MFDEGKYGNVDLIGGNAYVFEKITHRDVRYCCQSIFNWIKQKGECQLRTFGQSYFQKYIEIILKKGCLLEL